MAYYTKEQYDSKKENKSMKRKKIEYSTEYDSLNIICGFIYAKDCGDYYLITKSQYSRALKNRRIGGIAGIKFYTDKEIRLVDNYGNFLCAWD